MIPSIIKINISCFVLQILMNDALKYDFIQKGNKPNINGLLNKLIPNLLYFRKKRRTKIHDILVNDYLRKDADIIYECVNSTIDQVYFSDEELDDLDEVIWLRPSKENYSVFDEINESEIKITCQFLSEYIRGLLNEYSRLPQYSRERILFYNELSLFKEACSTSRIYHARVGNKSIRLFAFHNVYEFTYMQSNYLICYDLTNKIIGALPLYKVNNCFLVDKKYKPSELLIEKLQKYYEENNFDNIIPFEEETK